MWDKFIDIIDNLIEDSKDKEYVVYCSGITGYSKQYFTKKQLIKFINKHQLSDIDIYRIKDKIKIERELRIQESEDK